MRNSKYFKRAFIIIGILVLLLIALAPSYYFYNKYQEAKKSSVNASVEELKLLKEKIAKHIELPSNEDPILASVSDKNKLQDQEFFANSKNGDKVLIYEKARKAYLYRPSTDKLIEVSVLNSNTNTLSKPSVSPTMQIQETIIVLRNGTQVSGLTIALEPEISKALPGTAIIRKENAAFNDYQYTLVIALNEDSRKKAGSLAQSFGAQVSGLPANEIRPDDADIIVIIGNDKAPLSGYSPVPTQ